MPTLICPQCGIQFHRPQCHIRNATHCCSRSCSGRYQPRSSARFVEFKCEHCGRECRKKAHRAGTARFCDLRCARLATAPKRERHSNWKGGISSRSHAVRIAIRDRIKEQGQCERCGSTVHLQGHHRKSHSLFPELRADPANIEILCSSCHAAHHPQLAPMIVHPPKRTGIEIRCAICGVTKYVRPHRVTTAKYCSHACALRGLHQSLRGRSERSLSAESA